MQRGRIEIRPIGPSQCVRFWIDRDASKDARIAERTVQFSHEDRAEIDCLLGPIIEVDAESIGRDRLDLFAPQSYRRIDFCGPAGGKITRGQSGGREQRDAHSECRRIGRAGFVQQVRQGPRKSD
jgi:hypothetical protein